MFHIETIGFDVFVISRIILNDCTDLSLICTHSESTVSCQGEQVQLMFKFCLPYQAAGLI